MDGLQIEDVHGISDLNWKYDSSSSNLEFFATKDLFSPSPKDNIIINYGEKLDGFDFTSKTKNAASYFKQIDAFSEKKPPTIKLVKLEVNNPYEVSTSPWIYMFLLIPIVFISVFIVSVYLLIKYLKKRKLQT